MNDTSSSAITPVRLLLSGATGRMGRTIARLALADPTVHLVGGVDREAVASTPEIDRVTTIADASALIDSADVVVDFSAPAFLAQLLRERGAELTGKPIVVGTTGLGPAEEEMIREAARRGPVITATNFSLGVALLTALVERATSALGSGYDVEIVETHHRRKEDAPSGTAITLGEAVAKARSVDLEAVRRDGRSGRPGARPAGEIGFHALRGGDVVGEHQVSFIGDHDRIELTHRAADRALFAEGAIRAARWIVGRPAGRYSVRDVLGL